MYDDVMFYTLVYYLFSLLILFIIIRKLLGYLTLSNLHQRHVLVTGCDRGFGRLLVLRLLSKNVPVFATCLFRQGEEELRKDASHLPGKLEVLPMNVTSQQSVDITAECVTAKLKNKKGLWALVNNAGIVGATGPDDWMSPDDYRKVMEVNTLGIIRVTQAFKPLLKQTQGRLITMISIAGRVALPYHGPYSVSKYAIEAYCDIQRTELKPFGVSVHILEPGFFETELISGPSLGELFDKTWTNTSDHSKDEYGVEYLQATKDCTESTLQFLRSTKVSKVTDAYYHAITGLFPNWRYYPGLDTCLFIPFSVLPTLLQDCIISIAFFIANNPTPFAVMNNKEARECRKVEIRDNNGISIFTKETRSHRNG